MSTLPADACQYIILTIRRNTLTSNNSCTMNLPKKLFCEKSSDNEQGIAKLILKAVIFLEVLVSKTAKKFLTLHKK